jgi:hypothetical protein
MREVDDDRARTRGGDLDFDAREHARQEPVVNRVELGAILLMGGEQGRLLH